MDETRGISQTFAVQSIPAVFAIAGGQIVDQFIGALPEAQVQAFVERLAPAPSEADTLVAAGDETSLRRALELDPGHAAATEALARHPDRPRRRRRRARPPRPHTRIGRGAVAGR